MRSSDGNIFVVGLSASARVTDITKVDRHFYVPESEIVELNTARALCRGYRLGSAGSVAHWTIGCKWNLSPFRAALAESGCSHFR
jgi:hypothetical protein